MEKLTRLDQIRGYLYYLKELTELDMDRVVEVFNLVNSSGTKLSKSDLALAHICSKWPEARERFKEAKQAYAAQGFDFDLSFYTRLTSIVATGSALYDPLYKAPIEDVKAAWPKVTKALDYVFNVLKGDAFIDNASTFPSMYVVIPLAAFFATTGRGHFDSDAQKRSFLHWMYAALMWGRYSGSTDTKLQADIEALKSADPPAKLRENIVAERGRIKVEVKGPRRGGRAKPVLPDVLHRCPKPRGRRLVQRDRALPEADRQVIRSRDPSHLPAGGPAQGGLRPGECEPQAPHQ